MTTFEKHLAEPLTYDSQIRFKRFAKRNGIKMDFYFDDVDGVNYDTGRNIRGLKCDGHITWGRGLEILKNLQELKKLMSHRK